MSMIHLKFMSVLQKKMQRQSKRGSYIKSNYMKLSAEHEWMSTLGDNYEGKCNRNKIKVQKSHFMQMVY